MVKVNFSRVEEIVEKGLHKMKRDQLLELADEISGKKKKKSDVFTLTPTQVMIIVNQDLKWMKKADPKVFKKLKIKKAHIQELLICAKNETDLISQKKLDEIKEIAENVAKFKKEYYPQKPDEQLVEEEKKRHIYKRHNVSEKWLPLK